MALLELQAIFIALTTLLTIVIYRLYLHPLSKVPGPLFAKLTSLWIYREAYRGTEASTLAALHAKYGPIIRVAPNELDIADGDAVDSIYVKSGGFLKAPCYRNFDIDGFPTILSAIDPSLHSTRSKPVLPLFAQTSIRDGKHVIVGCVDRMVSRLEQEAEQSRKSGKPVNILTCARSLAVDAVTHYLFGESYGGLEEDWEKEDGRLSVAYFVDGLAALGRFFYLPPTVFSWLVLILGNFDINFGPDRYLKWKSQVAVDKYVAGIVDEAVAAEKKTKDDDGKEDGIDAGTFQARLLKAGMSRDETIAQCKNMIFAGTDSTSTNLCTICFHLVRNPEIYEHLRRELLDNSTADPQNLPYLSSVIKEGLRAALANPTRLPRVVGSAGLTVDSTSIPPGSIVGVSAHSLLLNRSVFPNPQNFEPARWLDPSSEMIRDSVMFGVGERQCIARDLATAELFWAVDAIVRKDVLRGARTVMSKIEIVEWFNSKVKGGKIELVWDR